MSIVRDNLLNRPGYTPYCGAENCAWRWPRTTFDGSQFKCQCGWRSGFEAEFIDQYKAKGRASGKGSPMTPRQLKIARHMLGLPTEHKRSYRNRYITGSKTSGYAVLMRMLRDGLVTRERFGAHPENRWCFALTKAAAMSALEPGETLDDEDFPAAAAA